MLTLKRNDCSNNEVNVPTSNPYQLKAQATALNTEFQAVFCALCYIEVISLIWSALAMSTKVNRQSLVKQNETNSFVSVKRRTEEVSQGLVYVN